MAALDLNWHAWRLDDVSFIQFWKGLMEMMGPTTRTECEKYGIEIFNGRKALARLTGITESVWMTYTFLKRCLRLATVSRNKNELGALDVSVRTMIAQAKVLLQSLEVPDDVGQYEIEMGCHGANRYTKWTAWFPYFVYHTDLFFISLLEAKSILEGLRGVLAHERRLLAGVIELVGEDFERFCPADWYKSVLTVFWFAGLAFPPAEFPGSMSRNGELTKM
jgi:hypothetical protein